MIIVTAGHVDHGKTALLQALTGTNTAHLPEEKKRGMTIDLGYAYLPLEERVLGFIDVPGHEKFLANMLAGLGGVHYAMLVVAADEGISAQTREHLAILRQLQFDEIIVVLTKADRAEVSQIESLEQQLKAHYPFLTNAAFFVTSAHSGQGIAELRDYLATLPELGEINKPFRYAIDRVFSVKGAGTVVTGTAFAGKVLIEDELYLSNGERVRVKNIHAQNTESAQGLADQRLALNLNVDLNKQLLARGDWLFSDIIPLPTERITVSLTTDVALSEMQSVHVYHAASRTTGKLALLESKNARPNDTILAEIVLTQPLFLTFGDKLIIRSGDAKSLLGGARVVEINSPKRHKRTASRLAYLQALRQASSTQERLVLILQQGPQTAQYLRWLEQLSESQLDEQLALIGAERYQDWCFNADYQAAKEASLVEVLSNYHEQHDDQLGLAKARLYRIAALNQPEKLIYHLIERLLDDGRLAQSRGWLHLPQHKLGFSESEQALWHSVLGEFEKASGQPIWVRDMANALGLEESAMRNFMYKAGKLGFLIPIVKDRFFLAETLYGYARLIKQMAAESGRISVNELRDQLNFGRKLTVQLMEYFDRSGFLRRRGNEHILRDKDIFDL